jgi:hypothetical protein
VKKFNGRWFEVGDSVAREKIGQCMRDQLHSKYKSSTKAKQGRRKELRELKKEREMDEKEEVSSEVPEQVVSFPCLSHSGWEHEAHALLG